MHDERVRARCTTSIILTFTDHGHIARYADEDNQAEKKNTNVVSLVDHAASEIVLLVSV